ncbi:MAG: pyridoxamine 5'-phosphate oxidase family protein [Spirochaetaceae bacterium]|nr:pyridoxamine 5'-phosphate oxidase family protein [Spirochaetaceae bacterium]
MDIKDKEFMLSVIKTHQFVTLGTIQHDTYPEVRMILNVLNNAAANLCLHFFTAKNSSKMQQIQRNNNCCLYYFDAETRKSLRLFGGFALCGSPHKDSFWRDDWEAFGYSGKDDPNWTVLQFTPRFYKFFDGSAEHSGTINAADMG